MEQSWNWHAEDWWNQQLENKVGEAHTARSKVENDNRSKGIVPQKALRAQTKPGGTTSTSTGAPATMSSPSEANRLARQQAGMRAGRHAGMILGGNPGPAKPRSKRWLTTAQEDQAYIMSKRHEMPARVDLVKDLRDRKLRNTTTTIDFSGFGTAPTPKDWASNAQIGQRDMSPDKIAAVQPTAAEREEQRQRKLNFKFKGQVHFGNEKVTYDVASKLPIPTREELMVAPQARDNSLSKMVKNSKIDYLFNTPDAVLPKDYQSVLRSECGKFKVDAARVMRERERAKKMKEALTKNQYDMKFMAEPNEAKYWRTTTSEATQYDPKGASQARGAEALELKKQLQRHHFEFGDDQVAYETQMQHANNILNGPARDPLADKRRALNLKKQLVSSNIKIGWQDDYF